MRQFDSLRDRYDLGRQWFQVGLASATLLTPLLKRWNDLRAAEQARAWREEAEARLRDVRSWNPLRRNGARQKAQEAIEQIAPARGNVSAAIWLTGVSIGLLAAGTGAYFLVRRRMHLAREEPMLDLPISSNGNGHHPHAAAQVMAEEISRRDERTASVTSRNGAASVPVMASPDVRTPAPDQAGPLMPPALTTNTTPATAQADGSAPVDDDDARNAMFVGNIHTMVYHAADADDLPAEENRVYFISEDEAHDAGYRRVRDEVSSSGE
ncbi:MAG TPA: hypothetical protein VKQ30_25625 [Ktedonobacterales bacterium]|nr:hypothetical protein [Ktedonobacterales bacterium]